MIKPRLKIFVDENKGFTVKCRFLFFFWFPFIGKNSHESIKEAEEWAKEVFKKHKKEIRL